MSADSAVLVAAVTRQVGRRTPTYSVIHLEDPDAAGQTYCLWHGQMYPSTVVEATRIGAVACNRCPQIKAKRISS